MFKNYCLIINDTDPNRWNCVKYVRARVPNLPFGLWNIWNKIKIIDSHKAKVGRVAIIKTDTPWGHLAIITGKGSNRIVIQEANFKLGKITERQGTPEDLKIVGYFNPQKKH
jgi:hypothetical protein